MWPMLLSPDRGAPQGAEITPVEPDPANTGGGRKLVPRCLTIAGSDSGGGAGIQADLKAFAAAGCHGMSVIVALTAQNTTGVTAVHEVPPEFVREPLVVVPVMIASSGAKLLRDDAVEALVARIFPLATVVTPNLMEAQALAGSGSRRELAERIHAFGAHAIVVTGGHGEDAVDHLFDGEQHVEIPVERYDVPATHGAGCTHSATLAALLAQNHPLVEAARGAAAAAASSVRNGLVELGRGDGPVDALNVKERDAGLPRADAARAARA